MSFEQDHLHAEDRLDLPEPRPSWTAPELVEYGTVRELTQTNTMGSVFDAPQTYGSA